MDKIKKYYNEFRQANSSNSGIKIAILVIVILYLFRNMFTGISNFPIKTLIISFVVLLVSMILHEVAHGAAAYAFGDDTAKRAGRLTLNPIKHIDLKGLLLPIILLLSGSPFLFGWAKPVPVNFYKLKPNRLGMFVVSIAGVTVNAIIATIALLILSSKMIENEYVGTFFLYLYFTNIILALFNLIPITPLDGGRIVYSLGNRQIRDFYDKIESYGIIIVFGLVYILSSTGIFERIMNFFMNILG